MQNTQPNCVVYRSITAVLTIVAVTIYCLLFMYSTAGFSQVSYLLVSGRLTNFVDLSLSGAKG